MDSSQAPRLAGSFAASPGTVLREAGPAAPPWPSPPQLLVPIRALPPLEPGRAWQGPTVDLGSKPQSAEGCFEVDEFHKPALCSLGEEGPCFDGFKPVSMSWQAPCLTETDICFLDIFLVLYFPLPSVYFIFFFSFHLRENSFVTKRQKGIKTPSFKHSERQSAEPILSGMDTLSRSFPALSFQGCPGARATGLSPEESQAGEQTCWAECPELSDWQLGRMGTARTPVRTGPPARGV